MSRIRKWIRLLFGFSGTETNGFLVLLPLLFIILFSEPVYRWIMSNREPNFDRDRMILDSLIAAWPEEKDNIVSKPKSESVALSLFQFDPNTSTMKEFKSLGLSEKIAGRIVNFRSKGGKFRIKADLLKIYGMDSILYRRLFSYIRLPEQHLSYVSTPKQVAKEAVSKFDLNLADSTELKKIYGIGGKLAKRIIMYRQKLGGFIRPKQLTEVYGLDSAVTKRLLERGYIEETYIPSKININEATDRELSAHPYISPVIAKSIVTYRFQHGNFAAVEDIRHLQVLKQEDADKIIPYLSVNQ